MKNNLIIFIDSFPFEILKETNYIKNSFNTSLPMKPGLGYSINIHAELFCGNKPDDIGYYNEWTYGNGNEDNKFAHFAKYFCNKYGRLPSIKLDKFLHKVFSRLSKDIVNIPFKYQDQFIKQQKSSIALGEEFMKETVFSLLGDDMFYAISETITAPKGGRDIVAFKQAMEHIPDKGNIFLSLVDLDSIGHAYGVGSDEYLKRVDELDIWVKQLCTTFLNENGEESNVFVLSDHGMANVVDKVWVKPESDIGHVGHDSYSYFTDATLMRVWVKNINLIHKIEDYLNTIENGRVLNNEDRKLYGITDKHFGDYIFLLNEGYVFDPSFVNRGGLPKAMHGYSPNCPNQKGIFISNQSYNKFSLEFPPNSIDIYNLFKSSFIQ